MAQILDRVVGHDALKTQLQQMWEQGRRPSALLFFGPPGVGKKMMAWAFIQRALCSDLVEGGACGECGSCRKVEKGSHEAVLRISSETHSLKLDSLSSLSSFLSMRVLGGWQFILIEGADKLNPQASNALLKSLEEPPEKTTFILTTGHPSRLLPTLKSRCQLVRFRPLNSDELKKLHPGAAPWMIRASQGRVDLLSSWLGADPEKTREDLTGLFFRWWGQEELGLKDFEPYTKDRSSLAQLLEFWQQLVRDGLYWAQDPQSLLHPDLEERWRAFRDVDFPSGRPYGLFEHLQQALSDLESNVDRSLIMENLLYLAKATDEDSKLVL